MKQERMAVLSLLEKGIINVEEAEKLIKTLGESNASSVKMEEIGETIKNTAKKFGYTALDFSEKAVKGAKVAGEYAGKKIKEAEPYVKQAVKTVSEKAEDIKEEVKERMKKEDSDEDIDVEKEYKEFCDTCEGAAENETSKEEVKDSSKEE
ncbi:MAG: hypothetical protein VB120_01840 [Lachnospiraceae bacterium]|nr:hypothetical protein [Lachnospiraceae bacterium]